MAHKTDSLNIDFIDLSRVPLLLVFVCNMAGKWHCFVVNGMRYIERERESSVCCAMMMMFLFLPNTHTTRDEEAACHSGEFTKLAYHVTQY